MTAMFTFVLPAVYRLGLLPLSDHFAPRPATLPQLLPFMNSPVVFTHYSVISDFKCSYACMFVQMWLQYTLISDPFQPNDFPTTVRVPGSAACRP